MNCTDAEQLLSRYLDDELGAADIESLEEHLASCAHCAEAHKSWSSYGELLRSSVTVGAQDQGAANAAWRQIRDKLGDQDVATGNIVPVWIVNMRILSALAAVFVISIGVYLGRVSKVQGRTVAQAETVEYFETDLPDASPLLYIDDDVGWTVVWVLESEASPDAVFQ